MQLTIRPLTPDLWPALEDLFGKKGACNGCWCMYCRIGAEYRKRPAARNKAAFRRIVECGPPPGLLAFHGDQAVGWCQLTPRDDLPALDRSWRLKRVDELPVWALSCFYVRIGYRRQGVTQALIAEALKVAKRSEGARARGLSLRRGRVAERLQHRVRFDFCARRLQSSRPPRSAAADHAPRFEESSKCRQQVMS